MLWVTRALVAAYILQFQCGYTSPQYDTFVTKRGAAIHVVTVDPAKYSCIPVRASEADNGRASVRTLSKRHRAVAGINGGFWQKDGTPAGALRIDNHWHSISSKPRGAIGWDENDGRVLIDQIVVKRSKEPDTTTAIEVRASSAPPHTLQEEWMSLEHIVGGTPVLICNGAIVEDTSSEGVKSSFLNHRHPRSAVGIRADGAWVFVVVDGRRFGPRGGVTVSELAKLMLSLECVDALNLDGGGSSTLVVSDRVVNRPRGDTKEDGRWVRRVSNAILVIPKD